MVCRVTKIISLLLVYSTAVAIQNNCDVPFTSTDYRIRINRQFNGWTKFSTILSNDVEFAYLYRYCIGMSDNLYWFDTQNQAVILGTSSPVINFGTNFGTTDCLGDEWLSVDQLEYYRPKHLLRFNIRDEGNKIGLVTISLDSLSMEITNSSGDVVSRGTLGSEYGIYSVWDVENISNQLVTDPRLTATILTVVLWQEIDSPDICSLMIWLGVPVLVLVPVVVIVMFTLIVGYLLYRKYEKEFTKLRNSLSNMSLKKTS